MSPSEGESVVHMFVYMRKVLTRPYWASYLLLSKWNVGWGYNNNLFPFSIFSRVKDQRCSLNLRQNRLAWFYTYNGLSSFLKTIRYLHSCDLQRARCICKYTPLHSAENQQRKDWNISQLRSYHCVESRCQCMFLRVDKGVINRNWVLKENSKYMLKTMSSIPWRLLDLHPISLTTLNSGMERGDI